MSTLGRESLVFPYDVPHWVLVLRRRGSSGETWGFQVVALESP